MKSRHWHEVMTALLPRSKFWGEQKIVCFYSGEGLFPASAFLSGAESHLFSVGDVPLVLR